MEVIERRIMWRKEAENASVQNGRALGNVARGDEQGYYGHEVCEGAVPAFSVAAAMYSCDGRFGERRDVRGREGGQACNGWHTVASRPETARDGGKKKLRDRDMRRERGESRDKRRRSKYRQSICNQLMCPRFR